MILSHEVVCHNTQELLLLLSQNDEQIKRTLISGDAVEY